MRMNTIVDYFVCFRPSKNCTKALSLHRRFVVIIETYIQYHVVQKRNISAISTPETQQRQFIFCETLIVNVIISSLNIINLI